jgi:hypothetical protein
MRRIATLVIATVAALGAGAPGLAAQSGSYALDVLVGGVPRVEYQGHGAIYVEALRGSEYTLRLTNPLGVRVAVALAVDGLNTIDARRSDVQTAAKWVLGPYESVEIPGWQVSGSTARAFLFTGERSSYGAWLGETANLGVIEAVFFRERQRPVTLRRDAPGCGDRHDAGGGAASSAPAAPEARGSLESKAAGAQSLADEYAATGIGSRRSNEVERVSLELERDPAAVVRVRYEFRPQLERLGLLAPLSTPSPLDRREGASGFSGRYCPEPPAR